MTVDELVADVRLEPSFKREGGEAKWQVLMEAAAAFVLGEIEDAPDDFREKLKAVVAKWVEGDMVDALFTHLRVIASEKRAEALGEPVRPWRDPRIVTVHQGLAEADYWARVRGSNVIKWDYDPYSKRSMYGRDDED
jgi:hypothetical protein